MPAITTINHFKVNINIETMITISKSAAYCSKFYAEKSIGVSGLEIFARADMNLSDSY